MLELSEHIESRRSIDASDTASESTDIRRGDCKSASDTPNAESRSVPGLTGGAAVDSFCSIWIDNLFGETVH